MKNPSNSGEILVNLNSWSKSVKFLQEKLTHSEEVDFMYGFIYETTNLINGKNILAKEFTLKDGTIEFISNAELSRKIGVNPSIIVRGKTKQSKDGLTIKFKDNPEPSIVKLQ